MSAPSPKVILQAHATRSAIALKLLLHGRDRSPLDRRSALSPFVLGILLTVVSLTAAAIAHRVGALVAARG